RIMQQLITTTGGTGYMHESFHPDDPTIYTRPWFGWANSLYGEFVRHWVQHVLRASDPLLTIERETSDDVLR
ncbi:glycoside hydrolase family 125 protein, partial [Shewanella algae]|uniref:glycoside hydrolase family 125 protein n=1 Tax=Shewanella algae TaxID=38313 RepID=UPI003184B512